MRLISIEARESLTPISFSDLTVLLTEQPEAVWSLFSRPDTAVLGELDGRQLNKLPSGRDGWARRVSAASAIDFLNHRSSLTENNRSLTGQLETHASRIKELMSIRTELNGRKDSLEILVESLSGEIACPESSQIDLIERAITRWELLCVRQRQVASIAEKLAAAEGAQFGDSATETKLAKQMATIERSIKQTEHALAKLSVADLSIPSDALPVIEAAHYKVEEAQRKAARTLNRRTQRQLEEAQAAEQGLLSKFGIYSYVEFFHWRNAGPVNETEVAALRSQLEEYRATRSVLGAQMSKFDAQRNQKANDAALRAQANEILGRNADISDLVEFATNKVERQSVWGQLVSALVSCGVAPKGDPISAGRAWINGTIEQIRGNATEKQVAAQQEIAHITSELSELQKAILVEESKRRAIEIKLGDAEPLDDQLPIVLTDAELVYFSVVDQAFGVLAELAEHTQVIVVTQDTRVGDWADTLPNASVQFAPLVNNEPSESDDWITSSPDIDIREDDRVPVGVGPAIYEANPGSGSGGWTTSRRAAAYELHVSAQRVLETRLATQTKNGVVSGRCDTHHVLDAVAVCVECHEKICEECIVGKKGKGKGLCLNCALRRAGLRSNRIRRR